MASGPITSWQIDGCVILDIKFLYNYENSNSSYSNHSLYLWNDLCLQWIYDPYRAMS